LRIFDRNQGEKARTQVDIGRNERLKDANEALVYSDVDSAYYTLGACPRNTAMHLKKGALA